MRARVVVAGGGGGDPVDPGLAVVRELQLLGVEVHWLGVRSTIASESAAQSEQGADLGRAGDEGWRTAAALRLLRVLPSSVAAAMRTLMAVGPSAVLCVGGRVSVAAALAAGLLGVPWVLLEPNCRPDSGGRFLAPWADLVCCGFADAVRAFPSLSAEWTGLPVRPELFAVPDLVAHDPARLLVIGGAEGSLLLNRTVPRAMSILRSGGVAVEVRHQAGSRWAEVVRASYQDLGLEATVDSVLREPWRALSEADLVVARAGAMTIAELAAAGRGMVLLPRAEAFGDHQEHNARALEAAGAAVVVGEERAEPRHLVAELESLVRRPARIEALGRAARHLSRPGAAARIARRLLEVGGAA